jgi:hypothetical protein
MSKNENNAWTGPQDGKKHKHILGQMIEEVQSSGRHITVLHVYQNSIDMDAESPAEVEVSVLIYGKAFVRCTVSGCDYVGIWHFGDDVLREANAVKKKKKPVQVYMAK